MTIQRNWTIMFNNIAPKGLQMVNENAGLMIGRRA